MKRNIPTKCAVAAAVAVSAVLPSQSQLIHRYSFNDPAGDATGATLVDSVGGADGVVQGAGALFTGTGLDLPGGDSNTQAYGDLPNGLISGLTEVTIEGWVTVDSNAGGWARIFDIGSTEPGGGLGGEVTGPGNTNGGGTAGLDYFFLSAARGGDYNVQRVEVRNEDPAGGGIGTFDSGVPTVFGDQIHYAVTWKDTGPGTSEINYWRNGVQLTTAGVVNSNLADLNDVNTWLGRSNWLNDANLDATFDEFRIYETALTNQQISISQAAGPDTVVDLNDDPDGDMIPTAYEELYPFLDPNDPNDAALDEDNDGLTNLEEFEKGTKPDEEDSDGDGLTDGNEANLHATNPLIADSDDDGLSDGEEINTRSTDPLVKDSDGDGIYDGPEVVEGLDPRSADPTSPDLLHRYAFNESAGPADVGSAVPDLVGGGDGIIVGSGGVWTGTSLSLPGGDGATADAAYVDLPNGLISSLDHLTFEAWYTVKGINNWSRIWDFGSTVGGEVATGMSGATEGQDVFLFAPNRGEDVNLQRLTVRNVDPAAPGGGTNPTQAPEEAVDTGLLTNLDQEYHVVGVWTSDGTGGGQLTVYRDGVREGTRMTSFTARDLNDVNNWLGRSNWTGDNYLNGELNEFRIYRGAMNDAAAAASFVAGPEAAPGSGAPSITSIDYNQSTDRITLSFTSRPSGQYTINWSSDLEDFSGVVTTGLVSGGSETTYGPFANPQPSAKALFFKVTEE